MAQLSLRNFNVDILHHFIINFFRQKGYFVLLIVLYGSTEGYLPGSVWTWSPGARLLRTRHSLLRSLLL